MKEKYCAVLMKKETLGNDYFLYKPIDIIEGTLNDDIFETNMGKEYLSMNDAILSKSEYEYCFANAINLEKLNVMYGMDGTNKDNQLARYYEDFSSLIYIGHVNIENTKIETKELDLYNLEKDISLEYITPKQFSSLMIGFLNDKDEYIEIKESLLEIIKKYDKKYNIKNDNKEILEQSRIEKELELNEIFKEEKKTLNIKELYEETKKVVKGQDEAIKDIVSAIKVDSFAKNPSERNRCLIVGKTGCGKTEIIRTIGNIIDRPFVRTDSTQITVAGYVGGTIEGNILLPLLSMGGGDLEKAENGIVALDEIDKKGSSSNDDVSGRGVLNSLLPFLDGTEFNVKYNNRNYRFDTSKLTVFALGAFMNILDYQTKNVLGFNSKPVEKKEVTLDDFSKIGMMPSEFIGRFPVLVMMNELTLDNYIDILVNSKNSGLKFYERFFEDMYNVNLKYTDKFIEEVAKKAMGLKTGARSLKRIIEESIKEARWDVMTSNCQYNEIILDEQTVSNPKIYKIN